MPGTGNWVVKDGVVTLHPREGEEGWQRYDAYLTTEEAYRNFVLEVEFSFEPEGNWRAYVTEEANALAEAAPEFIFIIDRHLRVIDELMRLERANVLGALGAIKAIVVCGYGNLDGLVLEKELGFNLPRSVAVTDDAMWVHDIGNRIIVRAALGYHAEETVALP